MRKLLLLTIVFVALTAWTVSSQPAAPVLEIVAVNASQPPLVEVIVRHRPPSPAKPVFRAAFGDDPLSPVAAEPITLPISLALVLDLSSRIADQGSVGSRFDDVRTVALRFLERGESALGTVRVVASTGVTATAVLTASNVAAARALLDGPQPPALAPVDLNTEPAPPYDLAAALAAATAGLGGDSTGLRLLVLLAAGDPAGIDLSAVAPQVEAARAEGHPIEVIVFGFGSEEPGAYQRYPAGPQSLSAVADGLRGSFVNLGVGLGQADAEDALNERIDVILGLASGYRLRLRSGDTPMTTTLRIASEVAEVSTQVELPAVAPRFAARSDRTTLDAPTTFSIDLEYAQANIASVEYRLNGKPVAPPVSRPFELVLDPGASAFQQAFPAGEYELSAVATDANGTSGTAVAKTHLTVGKAVPFAGAQEAQGKQGRPAALDPLLWLLPLLLIAAGLLAVLVLQRRRPVPAPAGVRRVQGDTDRVPRSREEATRDYSPGKRAPAERAKAEPAPAVASIAPATPAALPPAPRSVLEERTEPFRTPADEEHPRWALTVLEGDRAQRLPLRHTPEPARYRIGRRTSDNAPNIALTTRTVSRFHATLIVWHDAIDLIPEPSENGTFIGADRRSLSPGDIRRLNAGEIFWIGPTVKLCVERLNGNNEH